MRVGIAADHAGFSLKTELSGALSADGHEVVDFGAFGYSPGDDYPDYVVPLARAVAGRAVDRGVAICGSGVGAAVAANKIPGVRAGLIHEVFSAHQGVEDDNMNLICLGGRVTGAALARDLARAFLAARYVDNQRHSRRLAEVARLEEWPGPCQEGGQPNPLLRLQSLGQSVWLDFISRDVLSSGELQRLIEEDGLRGVTSNPSIFEKAISGSHDYDESIRALAAAGKSADEIYRALTVQDVQRAADLLRPVYGRYLGRDGFVSLEVSPLLAHEAPGTVAEARDLWVAAGRPNIMIKVPGTLEGLPAIRQLTAEGLNINITLLFSVERYRQVVEAYMAGLEDRAARDQPLGAVASVASFFLSRIDVLIDPLLEKMAHDGGAAAGDGGAAAGIAAGLLGKTAIASAGAAYQVYQELFSGERFAHLAAQGARRQRLLWASTGTKNPAYSDVKYVEALIGPNTVNTMTLETMKAYRDHGQPASRLEEAAAGAAQTLAGLSEAGLDLGALTGRLEDEGVRRFADSFQECLATVEKRRAAVLAKR